MTKPVGGLTTTAGSVVLGGNFGTSSLVLELDSATGITQTAGTLTAGTLGGNAGNGTVALGIPNAVGTLGLFTVSGGSFGLNDSGLTGALTVTGTVKSTTNDLAITGAPTLSVTGGVSANGTEVLSNIGTGGISLAANSVLSATVIDFATTGDVAEDVAGVVTAGALQSTGGVSGAVSLLGSLNAVSTVGNVSSGGDFALADSSALAVTGAIAAGASHNVFLQSANAAGIAVGGAASLSGSTVSVEADKFTNGGAITSTAFDLAPSTTGGAVTLGAAGAGLSLASLAGITTTDAI